MLPRSLPVVFTLVANALQRVAADPSSSIHPITVSTAVPSASAALNAPLPSQAALPPKQTWCPSEIFCAGAVLQTVNVAHLYPDDKTFVDKPTSKRSQEVLNDFEKISQSTTYSQVINFVQQDFTGEGQELEALTPPNFNANPPFLNNVTDTVPKAFAQAVHGFWNQLIRTTNASALCGSSGKCESSLIPLNHTFVVPGGRFREQYYWDSFWIVEGLLVSQLYDIAKDTLQNFMDELDRFGFIPNGGRIYYLNRSQPPLFIHMLARYVEVTGDTSILSRAIPLAEKELKWWQDNRSLQVKSPFSQRTFTVFRYAVKNSAPRPESYLTDYTTANTALNETQKAALYAELASGAETGWDYTMRWYKAGKIDSGLLALNVRNTIPVDLNSILYKNYLLLADLYGTSNTAAGHRLRSAATALKSAVLDLMWDSQKLAFYDFVLDTNSRSQVFTVATFYPFWSGIIPAEVAESETAAFGAFSSVNLVLNRYNGTYPTTFVVTGQQWDAPNAWPPHNYIILKALQAVPANVSKAALPQPSGQASTYSLIPANQLGISENELLPQPITATHNASTVGADADINTGNGTVRNGGNAGYGEGWSSILQRELANRYLASTLCSWQATGGSITGVIPRLSDSALNVTQSINNAGHMFEKFSVIDTDSAGRGGEYTVQAGFGWTNGVLLWVASTYGSTLQAPVCPNVLESQTTTKSLGHVHVPSMLFAGLVVLASGLINTAI